MESLIIDHTGFDVAAMSKLTEQDFVDIHKDTDAICRHNTAEEKDKWLRDAHKAVCEKAGVAQPVKKAVKKSS